MVAVAIHQTAVYLYKLDLNLGGHQYFATWEAPTSDVVFYKYYPDGKLPSLFFHKQYRDYDQYPDGVADIVGYWAEARILGGVVLFDRREPHQREAHGDVSSYSLPTLRCRLFLPLGVMINAIQCSLTLFSFILMQRIQPIGSGGCLTSRKSLCWIFSCRKMIAMGRRTAPQVPCQSYRTEQT